MPVHIGLRDLFWIFLRAGLAFGGGLGILAVMEDELVSKRRALSKEEFLALYGMGRIVPSGTMTALAVAFGFQFGGFAGTVVALVALILPALTLTLILAVVYQFVRGSPGFKAVEVTVLPAALAFIVAAAARLGQGLLWCVPEMGLAAAAFVAAFFGHLNPAILLIAGGVVAIGLLRLTEKPKAAPRTVSTGRGEAPSGPLRPAAGDEQAAPARSPGAAEERPDRGEKGEGR